MFLFITSTPFPPNCQFIQVTCLVFFRLQVSSPWQVHQPGTLPQTNGSRLHLSHLESKVAVSTPGTKRPLMCSFSSPKPGVLEGFLFRTFKLQLVTKPHLLPTTLAGNRVYQRVLNQWKWKLSICKTIIVNKFIFKKIWSWKVQLPSWRGIFPVIFSLNSSSLHSSMHPSLMAAHELPPASRGLRFTFKAPCQSQSHPKIHISVLLRADS